MDHADAVDVAQRLGEARSQFAEPVEGERALAADMAAEVLAGDVDRGHPGARRVRVGVHDGGGEGSADLAGGFHLTAEAGAELLVVGVLPVDDLQREAASRGGAAEIDDTHAAGTEPVLDRISADVLRVRVAQNHPLRPRPLGPCPRSPAPRSVRGFESAPSRGLRN